jgi:hypothetical protein
MKKIFRLSQKKDVLGRRVMGPDMHKYGLPYNGATGVFFPDIEPESIDLMLAAAERYFPEIHVVSTLANGHSVNCYVEDAEKYHLYRGNTDPDIEFTTELLNSDYTEAEKEAGRKLLEHNPDEPLDPVLVAGMNWMIQKIKQSTKQED